ncbi:TetR/AcrR family transcriptional regulator [Phreatobacter sp.]|uniref:TetR/AcrR family transcriptional regulator n=1 Tax=Phreatobacter sp. TaxID=1966341 RepID=UPI0022C09C16|nr:TetR/AcrR family transcriptional regulator [Phreatobacter sp.]MCZ8313791.1 TetR/AcrR family transcriptional regulator [Phreatobacter sp.]
MGAVPRKAIGAGEAAQAAAEPVAIRRRRTQAERRAEAESRMLSAAAEIVAEKGVDGLTLAEAGERAGYSRGLAGHYFRSKDELLAAMAEAIHDEFTQQRRERLRGTTGLARLVATIDASFARPSVGLTKMRAYIAVLMGAAHKPALAEAVATFNRDSATEFGRLIASAIEAGEIRPDIDARTQALILSAALRGIMAQWVLDPAGVDLAGIRAEFLGLVTRSLAAPPIPT